MYTARPIGMLSYNNLIAFIILAFSNKLLTLYKSIQRIETHLFKNYYKKKNKTLSFKTDQQQFRDIFLKIENYNHSNL